MDDELFDLNEDSEEEEDFDDLFDDEDELEIDLNAPHVRVLVPGRSPIHVAVTEEGATAADVLDMAGFTVRPGTDTVFVDGVQSGMSTQVLPGQTVTPVGAVKGG